MAENRQPGSRAIGQLAEEYVVALERKRLIESRADDLAELIIQVSLNDVGAGYDVRSYEVDGRPRHIEVKSSAGPRERFFVSSNEVQIAEALGESYWIVWIGWASRLPHGPCDVAWFRGPLRRMQTSSVWAWQPSAWCVERLLDDKSLQSDPQGS